MYEIIGRSANGNVMVLDYSDYEIDELTAQELQEATGMGLSIQETYPVNSDTHNFSESSMRKMVTGRDVCLINLSHKELSSVIFALFNKQGHFKPAVEMSLLSEDGKILTGDVNLISEQLGYVINNHYFFFRVDLGSDVPAFVSIKAGDKTVISDQMKLKKSIWSNYFISIAGLIDINTLEYKILPTSKNHIGYTISNYNLKKSSTGDVHIVNNIENASMFNISKFLGSEK